MADSISKRLHLFAFTAGRMSPATGVPISVSAVLDDKRFALPLKLLATDHAGFCAADLTIERSWSALRITPLGAPASELELPIKLIEADNKPLLAHVTVPSSHNGRPASLPSRDRDAIDDWTVSPSSFCAAPVVTLGDDGCSVAIPSTLPTHEFRFVKVLHRHDEARVQLRAVGNWLRAPAHAQSLQAEVEAEEERELATLVEIVEVDQTWLPCGHSLGALVHSLPLAPCETVSIAVIEATRSDSVTRLDDARASETLTHAMARDRSVQDTLSTALKATNSGWNLTGGASLFGLVSVGGGYSETDTLREVTSDALSALHDATVQASSVIRQQSGTVVVQASQAQRQQLQTRTITNHNHCHALTMQFFEVLRHFAVRTRVHRARRGLSVPYDPLPLKGTFPQSEDVADTGTEDGDTSTVDTRDDVPDPHVSDLRIVNDLKPILAPNLIREDLAAAFDAVSRMLYRGKPAIVTPADPGETDSLVAGFRLTLKRGYYGLAPGGFLLAEVHDKQHRPLEFAHGGATANYNPNPMEDLRGLGIHGDWPAEAVNSPPAPLGDVDFGLVTPVKWSELDDIALTTYTQGLTPKSFSLRGVKLKILTPDLKGLITEVTVIDTDAADVPKEQQDELKDHPLNAAVRFKIRSPRASRPATRETPIDERRAEDSATSAELIDHILAFKDFYSLRVAQSAYIDLSAVLNRVGLSPEVARLLDPIPIGYTDQALVYALQHENIPEVNHVEGPPDLHIALPTRGLLGEAQLGHCSACETRDVTRFWDWKESPCPENPPAITGVTPQSLGASAVPAPATVPANVVQIAGPPTDAGSAATNAALAALVALGPLSDMSGRTDTSNLLKELLGQGLPKHTAQDATDGGKTPGAGTGGPKAPPSEPEPRKQVDKLQVIQSAQDAGLISETDARDATMGVIGGSELASGDAGVAPRPLDAGRQPEHGIVEEVARRPRLKESYDALASEGWEVRLARVSGGAFTVEEAVRRLVINDIDVSYRTSADWIENATRRAFQLDDERRLDAIKVKGNSIWAKRGVTDLEKMARVYEWALWFWQYPSVEGDGEALLADMMAVFTELSASGMTTNDGRFRIPSAQFATSTGFKRTFRDDSNQVRHATASIKASFDWGAGGLAAMQLRERDASADHRLNIACNTIANDISHRGGRPVADIGSILRQVLGDPSETAPWAGPPDGDPAPPP